MKRFLFLALVSGLLFASACASKPLPRDFLRHGVVRATVTEPRSDGTATTSSVLIFPGAKD